MNKQKCEEALNNILKLKINWDGYGADEFSQEVIARAYKLLAKLDYEPDIYPTAQNSIQFEYEKPNGDYFEIELFEDKLKVFILKGGGRYSTRYCNIEAASQMVNRFVNEI